MTIGLNKKSKSITWNIYKHYVVKWICIFQSPLRPQEGQHETLEIWICIIQSARGSKKANTWPLKDEFAYVVQSWVGLLNLDYKLLCLIKRDFIRNNLLERVSVLACINDLEQNYVILKRKKKGNRLTYDE